MQNQTLAEIEALIPEKAGRLEKILNRMAARGTLFSAQKPGKPRVWRLMPSVVGWAETPFWGGRDTEEVRQLAPLWLKYREEAFGAELARNMPVMRVVPIGRSLKDESRILPYDVLKDAVAKQSYCAVAHCPCRQMKTYVGEGCGHSLENCLHFGSMGQYMVEYGLARKITNDEAVRILYDANQEGLVHSTENLDGHMTTICNCCGCSCVFLETKKKFGHQTISSSNYLAVVDAETCAACGTCEERCPMDAVAVGDAGYAEVDVAKCIGCGVCTPTCPTEAIKLETRAEVAPPPDLNQFFTRRFKA